MQTTHSLQAAPCAPDEAAQQARRQVAGTAAALPARAANLLILLAAGIALFALTLANM